jgi:glycosyltransferase involved in cell wall biosynthesis
MKISIVTPSYNQASHLDQTVRSVLLAADGCGAELEYIVVDGGSTDGSRDIIERHAHQLAWWCSEKDAGQYDAINKGFGRTTGEIMGWLNSSDLYFPWTLSTVREIFEKFPEVQWITSLPKTCIREDGAFDSLVEVAGFSASRFRRGGHGGPNSGEYIQQETCFWRRELWEKIGARITNTHKWAADFWLWGEFFKHVRCTGLEVPLAAFRFHGDSRSTATRYVDDVTEILKELNALPIHCFASGYQNIVRQWIPSEDGKGGRSNWKLDRHADDAFLEIFRWWLEATRELKWVGSKLTYLPLAFVKFCHRGFRRLPS